MLEEVRKQLFGLQDLKYQQFHSRLCPGVDNIIGVRTPDIRKITKELLKKDYISYIESTNKKYYEEIMIEGLLISLSKMNVNEKITYLDKFIPKINCWAITDICSASFKLNSDDKKIMWDYLLKYKKSNKEYELRFMIVMWMNHYLTDGYWDLIFDYIDKIKSDYYYVKMAIAWLISVVYVKDSSKTLNYLKNNNLDDWTYNKSLQKIIESNRVTKEEKEIIKAMKKRLKLTLKVIVFFNNI